MKKNLILKASAGTGKTFAIATRFLKLAIFRNVRPETVLGLTFSRAAAQEIYTKIIDRLCDAAESERGAEKEKGLLLADADAKELELAARVEWTPAMFAGALRRILDAQHRGTIATLDSFIQRVVRSFPLEMGFGRSLTVLDDFGRDRALDAAVGATLAPSGADPALDAEFWASQGGAAPRTVRDKFGSLANPKKSWTAFLRDRPEAKGWTGASMRKAMEIPPEPPDLSGLPYNGKSNDPLAGIAERVAEWAAGRGEEKKVFDGKPGEVMLHLLENPEATSYTYFTKSMKPVVVDCGGRAGAESIRAAARYLAGAAIGRRLDAAAAQLRITERLDRAYDAVARRNGRLTFDDITASQSDAERSGAGKAVALENLQFRLDAEFRHWALDEFQDTSAAQWNCLRRLVEEAAAPDTGDERSVLAVGDLKQSIYTWRGGDDGPFLELENFVRRASGADAVEELPVSRRYGPNTVDFVNAVFCPENVYGVVGDACPDAQDKWASECWPKGGHKPETDADGTPTRTDFFEILRVDETGAAAAAADGDDDSADDERKPSAPVRKTAPALCRAVRDFWNARCAAGSGESVGILVRRNGDGLYLAELLRALDMPDGHPLPVVWEGESGVLDTPVSRAVLEMLSLADHPEDKFAWAVVHSVFPLREIVFPGLATPGAVSRAVAKKLSRLGLSRTLREIAAAIAGTHPDTRTAGRLADLVRAGVEFEERPDCTGGVAEFREYLEGVRDRETASSPEFIRILTIHRAKGLTLDHVFVPIGSSDPLAAVQGRVCGDGWVLGSCPDKLIPANDALAAAAAAASDEQLLAELRTHYVALTRARRSTHVFLPPDDGGGSARIQDLVSHPFENGDEDVEPPAADCGATVVAAAGTPPDFSGKPKESAKAAPPAPWTHGTARAAVRHATPSSETAAGGAFKIDVARRFASGETARGGAVRRGMEEHAAFAAVEWIDPAAPKDDRERRILSWGGAWREAFLETPGAVLWRERSYELFRGAEEVWETGQFDRVVFRDEGADRRAEVYDFKTNAVRKGEDAASFESRMKDEYAGQMAAYRKALSGLCGLPPDRIRTTLLLASTGTSAEV